MRGIMALVLALVVASCTQVAKVVPASSVPVALATATPPATSTPAVVATLRPTPAPTPTPTPNPFYTLEEGDWDWGRLVDKMGVQGPDPIGEILRWNPEVKNPYDLKVGQRLRIPRLSSFPSYPAFNLDYSQWKVIASHTSKFAGSSDDRIHNIVTGANYLNNWFTDGRHPSVLPREKFGLNQVFGDTSKEKGYRPGFAILVKDGKQLEVPSDGGGICQIPSTIFPAILKAGLNVLERQNHSYYPYWWWGYPEGFGWDATINTPDDPDLVFRNMYDYPVRLWAVADVPNRTIRIDVYGPPELKPYQVQIEGPYLVVAGVAKPIGSNWITGDAKTTLTQSVNVGSSTWIRSFSSSYAAAPH